MKYNQKFERLGVNQKIHVFTRLEFERVRPDLRGINFIIDEYVNLQPINLNAGQIVTSKQKAEIVRKMLIAVDKNGQTMRNCDIAELIQLSASRVSQIKNDLISSGKIKQIKTKGLKIYV